MTDIQTTLIDTTVVLTSDDLKLIQRSSRLLVMIMQPENFERARHEGYTTAEHRFAWRLVATASGANVLQDDRTGEAKQVRGAAKAQDKTNSLLQRLDAEENVWLPRARVILRRAVPPSRRDAFEAAFFADLEQQPLGPGVVNSVGLFAARVEGLEASADPDAQAFRELLSARGLTEERVAELKAMVAQAQAVAKPRRAPDAEALANMQASRAERLEALQQLRDWYAEWSVGLRPHLHRPRAGEAGPEHPQEEEGQGEGAGEGAGRGRRRRGGLMRSRGGSGACARAPEVSGTTTPPRILRSRPR
jgi:hypothetical protein